MKKFLLILISYLTINLGFASTIKLQQGKDYTLLNSINTPIVSTPGKVGVVEFYSFACIHCALTEPLLDAWQAKIKNVEVKRIQVVWENNFKGYAKINATIEALNLKTEFSQKVFDAVTGKHQDLQNPSELQKFLNANKNLVNPTTFMNTYNSFTIASKPQEYAQYTQAYNITGTPTFIVANKYVVSPAQPERLMQVVQALIDKVKKEQNIK